MPVPLYSLSCGSRVVLSDDQRPKPLNTGCAGAAPDSTDPLAQFLSERAETPSETDRALRSAEDDRSLLAFTSETAVTDVPTVSGASGYRQSPALRPVVATTVMRVLSRVRVAARPFLRGLPGALRASRDAADRLRAQFVALTGVTARARRFRRIAATLGGVRQRGSAVQSHRWAYPAGLFLSGAAAGAFLVMIARVPVEKDVAAQVSVQPTTRVAAAHYIVTDQPRLRAPTLAARVQIEPPVSTTGVTASARQQSAPQAPVAVATRAVRTRPQTFVGSISINSRPQGAVVFLNGRRVGTTPLLMPELPVGSRAVRLTMSGYNTWSQAVQVVADRRTTVSATLMEAPSTTVAATLVEASRQ